MKNILIIMILFSALFGSRTKGTDTITILTANEFKAAISKGDVQLVDVRTAREYKSGHISKALNIDFFQRSAFMAGIEKLDKSKPVYLYCRSGNRSQKAARMISEMGFRQIFDLQGGYLSWN